MGFGDIHRADLGVEILREEVEHALAQRLEPLLSLDALGKPHLSGAEPCLDIALPVVARQDAAGDTDQDDQCQRPGPRHRRRERDAAIPGLLRRRQAGTLDVFELGHHTPETVHCLTAAIAPHERRGVVELAGLGKRHGLGQFVDLLRRQALDDVDTLQLRRIAGYERPQPIELTWNRGAGVGIRLEMRLFPGQEKSALTGFRILESRKEALEPLQHLQRVRHPIDSCLPRLSRAR